METEYENTRFLTDIVPRHQYQPQFEFRMEPNKQLSKINKQTTIIPYKDSLDIPLPPFQYRKQLLLQESKVPTQVKGENNNSSKITPLGIQASSGSQSSYLSLPRTFDDRTTKSVYAPTDIKTHYINIDTKYRNNTSLTTSTNFKWRLYKPIKNTLSIRVASIEIPNNYYSFSYAKQNITFYVKLSSSPSYTTLILPEGNYNVSQLESSLDTLLKTVDLNFTVTLSSITGKTTIQNLVNTFDIKFPLNLTEPFIDLGLAYNLGFQNTEYTNQSTLTGEKFIDILGDHYIFLQIGDYDGIDHSLEMQNLITATAKIIINVDKYSVIMDNGSNFISKEVLFSIPTNITSFDVKLLDSNNKVIDLKNTNFSFTLEIKEIINSHLYTSYNDHLLQNGDTPR